MFKKTAIAAAVAGIAAAPMAAQADGHPTVYGFVNIGLQSTSIDGTAGFGDAGVGSNIFFGSPDGSVNASDTANTRFGFKGSKDLGNGLSAGYKIEIGMGTTSGGRGGPVEDAAPWDKRIAEVTFSGDFGTFKAGNSWGLLYEFLGWNTYRTDGHGGANWYEATHRINNDRYGLRVSNAFSYTYGGGGYSADPFTFAVQAYMDPDSATNDESLDGYTVAAAATFGSITINGALYGENNSANGVTGPEAELVGLGFRWWISDALYLGGTIMNVDPNSNASNDEVDTWQLTSQYSFGNGLSGTLGLGGADNDAPGIGDFSNWFLGLSKSLGQGVKIYAELEDVTREYTDGRPDAEGTVFVVAIKNVF